ncbi:MAG: SAM-dependent methyltransferase [Bacilli bacterium]|nr:SAM-dependent methyltransferase [Bacilli bacterium]
MIKLSKRLELVASYVSDNSTIIDVGCDHAHLGIYLCENKKNIKVLESDVNPNPLKIAKDNIKKYGMEDRIEIVLKDGINDLDNNIDTVIMSGMGGLLMSRIINNKENLTHIKTLILSPNNEFIEVRKIIKKIGFKIEKEQLITENKQTYLVIKAIRGKGRYNNFFGTLKNNELENIYYYSKLFTENNKILKLIPKKNIFKIIKLKRENRRIKSFLEKRP